MRNISKIVFVTVLLVGLMPGCSRVERSSGSRPLPDKPNIIIILADDLGYSDTSAYEGWVPTPHLKRMAAEGLRFTDFHTNGAVCSPTRAGLMTGRYQQRAGIENVIVGTRDTFGLEPDEFTIPRMMKNLGYPTALFGKWHLGTLPRFNPVRHGFDKYLGYLTGGADYHYHATTWYNGTEKTDPQGYGTHLITDNSVRFIEENKERPFFLYISHQAVHLPFQTPDDPPYGGPDAQDPPKLHNMKYWDYWTNERIRPKYKIMMQELDTGIGEVLDTIRRCGIAENTFVFFFSDNGAIGAGSNRPFRGGKASLLEGGHRVPAIAWWPGRIKAGSITNELALGMDLLPTLAELTGAEIPAGRMLDGISLKGLLLEETGLAERQVFWGYAERGTGMRDKNWKFIVSPKGYELYDLNQDPGETNNLAEKFPERSKAMWTACQEWLRDVHQSDLQN